QRSTGRRVGGGRAWPAPPRGASGAAPRGPRGPAGPPPGGGGGGPGGGRGGAGGPAGPLRLRSTSRQVAVAATALPQAARRCYTRTASVETLHGQGRDRLAGAGGQIQDREGLALSALRAR